MTPDKFLAKFNIWCKQVRLYAKLAKRAIGLHRKIDVLNGTIDGKDREIQRLKGELFKMSVQNAELEKRLRLAGVKRNPVLVINGRGRNGRSETELHTRLDHHEDDGR